MAHVIAAMDRPCLVLCHNKTLAAQLCRELRSFLSQNAVELFVSYYNHYVPESFVEATGKYIAKKTSVNAEIDALRHRATRALLTRSDVVVVASVSCIYGLGLPKEYLDNSLNLRASNETTVSWVDFCKQLDTMLYTVSDDDEDFQRGQYQLVESEDGARKTISLWPPHDRFPMQFQFQRAGEDGAYCISDIQLGGRNGFSSVNSIHLFPAKHHVVSEEAREVACERIEEEMRLHVRELVSEGKHIEAERLQKRVVADLFMIRSVGYCNGVENYSRHFSSRQAGEPPDTLMD
jgi:excinuclease ABC subunit B